MNVDDEVTINAVIIGMTESGNPIIKTPAGVKMLVKASDVVTVRPPVKVPEKKKGGKKK